METSGKKGDRASEMGRVEEDIDDLPKNDANYTALTPLWFLERAALVHPDRKSLIHGSRHYTWSQTYPDAAAWPLLFPSAPSAPARR